MISTNKPIDGPIGGGGGGGGTGGGSYSSGGAAGSGWRGPGGSLSGFSFKPTRRPKGELPFGMGTLPQAPPAPSNPQIPSGFGNQNQIMKNSTPDGSFLGENYFPYFGIAGREGFGVPMSQLGFDPTVMAMQQGRPGGADFSGLNSQMYQAALGQGYPTRERVQQLMQAQDALGSVNLAPRVSPPTTTRGQGISGQRPDSYLAARDRRFGGVM